MPYKDAQPVTVYFSADESRDSIIEKLDRLRAPFATAKQFRKSGERVELETHALNDVVERSAENETQIRTLQSLVTEQTKRSDQLEQRLVGCIDLIESLISEPRDEES